MGQGEQLPVVKLAKLPKGQESVLFARRCGSPFPRYLSPITERPPTRRHPKTVEISRLRGILDIHSSLRRLRSWCAAEGGGWSGVGGGDGRAAPRDLLLATLGATLSTTTALCHRYYLSTCYCLLPTTYCRNYYSLLVKTKNERRKSRVFYFFRYFC